MPNNFALSGSQGNKPTRFSSIFTSRFFTGLWSQRNPLRDAGSTRYEEKFLGTRGDSLIDGSNTEVTNRLTVARRPGNSVYNTQDFLPVDLFYDFHLFSTTQEKIKVIVDTAAVLYDGTGPNTKSIIWNKSAGAGQTYPLGVGNVLFFGNGVDQKKWQNTLTIWTASTAYSLGGGFPQTFFIDPNGNIQQLTGCILPISNVAVDGSNNVTITSSVASLPPVITTNLQVLFSGLTAATFLDGQTITIDTVTTHTFTGVLETPHASYGPTVDAGLATVVQGGNPVSGSSQPTWNVTVGGTTNDGSAQWTNRGSTIENWGIAGPLSTEVPTVAIQGSVTAWQADTYYSNSNVIVDSNGNLQQITTAGKSGISTPAWATGLGDTTTDGTVTWTVLETAPLSWVAHTAYPVGTFITGTASGTLCLFESVTPSNVATISGGVTARFYPADHSWNGGFGFFYPLSTGSATATATGNSLAFNPPALAGPDPNVQPIQWATLDGSGAITGYTVPWSGATEQYDMVVVTNLVIPTPGNYTITIAHDDGMIWGIGNGSVSTQTPTKVSGPSNDSFHHMQTATHGYGIAGGGVFLSGTNQSGNWTDTFVVNFPVADTYPIEIDYAQWQNEQNLVVSVNNQFPVPSPVTSGATQPIWPAFSTSFAPNYPSITESRGQIQWNNLGPVTPDYSWAAKTQYITTADIIDTSNNIENPFEAGISGSSPPVAWATGVNQLTNDNPNLIWINQGPAAAPPSGSVTTVNGGWIYCIALVNTLDNTVSNAGPLTVTTGDFFGATGVKISGGLPTTIDPQVDYVAIFRTLDGGATPFLIQGTGNSIYTIPLADYQANGYTDTTPNTALNILLEAPTALQNTPPGIGAINLTYHLNRIFFSIGNVVYWTSNGDTPVGNGTNGVGPLNNATFPSLVTRIVPMGIGAIVFTVSDIFLLAGTATANNPLFAQPYATGIGLLSYNALAINGTTIGWFSSDSQFLLLDPNSGFSEAGFPIGNLFEMPNWTPQNVYVTWHVSGSRDKAWYVSDGSTGWFRLNPTAAPESGLTWSPFASIVGGCKAVQSIEVSPGVHKLLVGPVGPTASPLLNRDLNVFSDNGVSYTAFFTVGSVVLAHPGEIAELGFMTVESVAVGLPPTISILLDEVSGPFEEIGHSVQDPPILEPSTTLFSQRFYLLEGELPALCRHMQYRIDWIAEAVENEILSISLYGGFAVEM